MAKLISLETGDPRKEITFQHETLKPHNYGKKRVGQPRKNWFKVTMADFWEEAKNTFARIRSEGHCNLDNPLHVEHIQKLAAEYNAKHKFSTAEETRQQGDAAGQ